MSEPTHKPTEVIGHAEAAALYFRTLIDEGVPLSAAITMAAQYATALVLAAREAEEPRRGWEEGGHG